jgi:hypothetical protein
VLTGVLVASLGFEAAAQAVGALVVASALLLMAVFWITGLTPATARTADETP